MTRIAVVAWGMFVFAGWTAADEGRDRTPAPAGPFARSGFDLNGDGIVSLAEIETAFLRLDLNRDGILDVDELSAGARVSSERDREPDSKRPEAGRVAGDSGRDPSRARGDIRRDGDREASAGDGRRDRVRLQDGVRRDREAGPACRREGDRGAEPGRRVEGGDCGRENSRLRDGDRSREIEGGRSREADRGTPRDEGRGEGRTGDAVRRGDRGRAEPREGCPASRGANRGDRE